MGDVDRCSKQIGHVSIMGFSALLDLLLLLLLDLLLDLDLELALVGLEKILSSLE
jgi:hypothetical protein